LDSDRKLVCPPGLSLAAWHQDDLKVDKPVSESLYHTATIRDRTCRTPRFLSCKTCSFDQYKKVIVYYIFEVINHSNSYRVSRSDFLMRTRQYILEAAERMLQTKGLARLTNKEIAEAAGCAEGTLYNHFDTKEALILAAIQENQPDFLAAVGDDRIGEHSIEENLQEIALAAIRYYQKLVPLATALFADMDLLAHFRL
jgi:tetracycline repressor-like protein